MNNNRRRNFRGRQQKNNFRRRPTSNHNNNGHFSNNTGNKNFTIFSDENTFEAVLKNSLTQVSVEQSKFEDSVFAPMHGIIKINNY